MGTLGGAQAQSIGQQRKGVAVGSTAQAALEGANGANAEAGTLGELFLSEAGGEAKTAQQGGERLGLR
jgi:hypothetical protein